MNKAKMLLMTGRAGFALSTAVLPAANAENLTHSRPYDNTGTGPQQSRLDGGGG
jgi:hypothetical protein